VPKLALVSVLAFVLLAAIVTVLIHSCNAPPHMRPGWPSAPPPRLCRTQRCGPEAQCRCQWSWGRPPLIPSAAAACTAGAHRHTHTHSQSHSHSHGDRESWHTVPATCTAVGMQSQRAPTTDTFSRRRVHCRGTHPTATGSAASDLHYTAVTVDSAVQSTTAVVTQSHPQLFTAKGGCMGREFGHAHTPRGGWRLAPACVPLPPITNSMLMPRFCTDQQRYDPGTSTGEQIDALLLQKSAGAPARDQHRRLLNDWLGQSVPRLGTDWLGQGESTSSCLPQISFGPH